MLMYVQRYLCGNDLLCSKQCDTQAALALTFSNIERYYAVVGLLERLGDSLEYLQWKFPAIFNGYSSMMKLHTNEKNPVLDQNNDDDENDSSLRQVYCQKYAHECSLHDFVKKRFHFQYQQMKLAKEIKLL